MANLHPKVLRKNAEHALAKPLAFNRNPSNRAIRAETIAKLEKIVLAHFKQNQTKKFPFAERNTRIFLDYFANGRNCSEIGKKHSLTPYRILLIVTKAVKMLKEQNRFRELAKILAETKE